MKHYEISKEEKNKWLDSKDMNKGFFVRDSWSNDRSYEGYQYPPNSEFNSRITLEYYIWAKDLKMGDLSDLDDGVSYFYYLLDKDYLVLDDSLLLETLDWVDGADSGTESSFDGVDSVPETCFNEWDQWKKNPVVEYTRIRESEFMENMEKYWTFQYGFFDLTATLKEKEDFANEIVEDLYINYWEDYQNDEVVFDPANWEDEDDWGTSAIVTHVLELGGKVKHTLEVK